MVEVPPISPEPDGFTNGEPRWVGKYRILEVLGEGGMGVVYLAEERGAVQRRVALKLVKGGNDGESMIRRFEMERRALAVMEHENIAKVFFAGTSDEGRPYFVMEYVIGVPVTEYCNKQCLGVRERIELFLPICAGVQHAHHKGVIHRDIKPSNVLVAVQDGAPLPKIIDFGLARAADDVIHKLNDCTRPGAVVGTPDYMSPEQAGVNNLDIDTRTDIYSLGAVLYELLTGARPFRLGGLRNVDRIDEVLRIIHQDDPPTPSSRVASNDEAVPSMPIDKRALRRCLRGDLDWITMKALAKDRTQRYQNASELATDLRRYLDDEPVPVGPPSTVYRLRKFARRHRAAVAAGAVIALVLVVSAVSFAALWRNAERSRETAERQSTLASNVKEFLREMLWPDESELFDVAFPDVRLSQLLARSAKVVESTPPADPEIEAEICEIIGMAYRTLGLHREAEFHLARARQLCERDSGPDSERSLDIKLNHALALERTGRMKQAGDILQQVLDVRRARLDAHDRDSLHAALTLALNFKARGMVAECEALATRTLATAQDAVGPEDNIVGLLTETLAWCYMHTFRLTEAEQAYDEATRLAHLRGEPDDPRVVRIENNFADFLFMLDQPERAEPLLRHARECVERSLGPTHPYALAVLSNLGKCRSMRGDFEEAVQLWRRVADERMRFHADPSHQEVLKAQFYLGVGLHQAGLSDEAEDLLRAAQSHADASGPPGIWSTLLRQALGRVLLETERTQEAVEVLLDALHVGERCMQRDPVGFAKLQIDAGQACQVAGDRPRARVLLDAGLATVTGKLPPQHRLIVKAREYLSKL